MHYSCADQGGGRRRADQGGGGRREGGGGLTTVKGLFIVTIIQLGLHKVAILHM